ncbi:MAG: hypothetical protein IT262_01725 [Saprospiraceae bacterium]|nr:hypothetical protein [Saprospiraceae bacterium]
MITTPTTGEIKDLIVKEMDFIQSVITRMANNSFLLKGWLIGILSFILAFNKEAIFANSPQYAAVLVMPVLIFWYLDAFFLYTEQQYRELYKEVATNRFKYLFGGQLPDGLSNLFNLDYTRFEDYRVARKSIWAHLPPTFSAATYQALKDTPPENLPKAKPKKIPTIFRVMFSKTLLVFYVLPLIFIVIIVVRPIEKKAEKVQKIEIIQPKSEKTPSVQ